MGRRLVEERRNTKSRLLVLMGPAGAGKSTIGPLAAQRLGVRFFEGDDYHPYANIKKMMRGVPLLDADRRDWIAGIGAAAREQPKQDGVLACSALSGAIRKALKEAVAQDVTYILLDVPEAELRRRLEERQGHFAGPALLESQLALFDAGADVQRVDATSAPEIVANKVARLYQKICPGAFEGAVPTC